MKRKIRQTTLAPPSAPTPESQSSAAKGECPVCGKEFPLTFLNSHVSFHFDNPSPSKQPRAESTSPNVSPKPPLQLHDVPSAFDVLRDAQKHLQHRSILFRLDILNGKLLPVVLIDEERRKHDTADATQLTSWTAEISMKQVTAQNEVVFPRCKLTLCTNISPATHVLSTNVALIPARANTAASIAILKSMMQKAFRRRRAAEAARLALYLCRISIDECLRRICIIIIEDGALHAGFPVLVWCMMAQSKGYLLPDVLLSVCIAIFAEAAHNSVSDYPISTGGATAEAILGTSLSSTTLLQSVLFRAAYGGMAHDIVLLVDAVMQWRERFVSNACVSHTHKYLHEDYVASLCNPDFEHLLCLRNTLMNEDNRVAELLTELYRHIELTLSASTTEGVYALSTLQISASDLIIEGIDHISDRQLVPHIISRLHQSVELEAWKNQHLINDITQAVEQCIGTFRSFVNTRQEYAMIDATEMSRRLENKKMLSGLWRLICPVIREYCGRKLEEFARLLRLRQS